MSWRIGRIGTYIYIHKCDSVHKCHINLIFSPGKYPFFEEYSERYLPYFRHPRDVTGVVAGGWLKRLNTASAYSSQKGHAPGETIKLVRHLCTHINVRYIKYK